VLIRSSRHGPVIGRPVSGYMFNGRGVPRHPGQRTDRERRDLVRVFEDRAERRRRGSVIGSKSKHTCERIARLRARRFDHGRRFCSVDGVWPNERLSPLTGSTAPTGTSLPYVPRIRAVRTLARNLRRDPAKTARSIIRTIVRRSSCSLQRRRAVRCGPDSSRTLYRTSTTPSCGPGGGRPNAGNFASRVVRARHRCD